MPRRAGGGNPVWEFARKHKVGALGALIVLAFFVSGALAPWIAPYDPLTIDVDGTLKPPGSPRHLLGTDNQGRDLLSRILHGGRLSLWIAMTSVITSAVAGILFGTFAAYYPGSETLIMRVMDMLLAFPGIIVALTIISLLGTGIENLIIAIAISQVPQYARLAHGLTLSIKEKMFVEAAVALGASDRAIVLKHIVPNLFSSITVQTSLMIPTSITTAASLSFLGLGVQPPNAEWGSMLQNAMQWSRVAPHVMIIPGMALMLVVFGFNVLGDGLRDALDPRLRSR
ncbi:MAG: ABC transporter permease [Armatimonadetes bacterium]|nr:ABC transporter permease [Armatimonadota bacterium]